MAPDRAPLRAALPRGSGLWRKVRAAMRHGAIVVFRIQLLPPSETFIVTQAAAMRRFSPFFVGWRRMAGIDLPQDKTWTANDGGWRGKLEELRFRYVGPSSEQL